MSQYDLDHIRANYHALVGIKEIISTSSNTTRIVEGGAVREYERFLADASVHLPHLLVPFNERDYFSHSHASRSYYRADGILMHISRNLALLQVRVDEGSDSAVITAKSFHFINEPAIRNVLDRDYQEIQRNIVSHSWKSAIILSGGSIEAILLDLLKKNEQIAIISSKAPKETSLDKWHLNDLIDVAVQEKLINSGIATLSHSVRDYRNLIHPGLEIRKELKVEPEEANIAVNILDMLIRELS